MAGLLLLLLATVGCGDDAVPSAFDLSAAPDLASKVGASCGVDGVRLSCGGSCAVCYYAGSGGSCVLPCKTASPSCPTGKSCHPARSSDGGATSAMVQFDGDCAAYDGYCN